MHDFLIDFLICPACHQPLAWTVKEKDGARLLEAEARCEGCGAVYPVREGVGLFLTPDLPRDDLWEQADTRLSDALRAHPEIERQLMDAPIERLNPTDLWFRAKRLDERGDYLEARALEEKANQSAYSAKLLACQDGQFQYLLDNLPADAPIFDLACGRGWLIRRLLVHRSQPIVATDFSPSILRTNRRRFAAFGLDANLSLVACDARRMPFKDKSIQTLTTFVGLQNIEKPGEMARELFRIVGGAFWALSQFYHEDDAVNSQEIYSAGLQDFSFEKAAVAHLESAGFRVSVESRCSPAVAPTPTGIILSGAQLDRLPVAPTTIDTGILVARRQ